MIWSDPYCPSHPRNNSGRVAATLPIVTSAAPLDAATEVYRQAGGRSQTLQYFVVDDMFGACPVEVHDVQTVEAVSFYFPRHGYRVFVVGLLRGVISFGQPYAFAVYQVYGRYQFDHTVKFKKFFNMRSPTFPLFSGWNCVA